MEVVKEENEDLKWECKELKDKQKYQNEQYEELDRENNLLREDSRRLDYFKEYLPQQTYERIVDIADREEIKRR